MAIYGIGAYYGYDFGKGSGFYKNKAANRNRLGCGCISQGFRWFFSLCGCSRSFLGQLRKMK